MNPSADYSLNGKAPMFKTVMYQSQNISSNLAYNSTLQITFPKTASFYDLSSLFLKIRCRVVGAEGQVLAGELCFVKANSVGGLFERVCLYLNGEAVVGETHNHQLSNLDTLLFFGKQLRENALGPVSMHTVRALESGSLETVGEGMFVQELRDAAGSRTMTLMGPVSPILSSCPTLIPSQTELVLKLERCSDREVLGSLTQGFTPHLEFLSVTAYIKCYNLTPSALSRAEESLRGGGLIPLRRSRLIVRSIPEGSGSFRWGNIVQSSPLPDSLFFAFVKESAFMGSHKQLSTFYEGFPVKSLSCFINEIPFTQFKEYQVKFEKDGDGKVVLGGFERCGEVYYSLLQYLSLARAAFSDFPITYSSFQMGSVLYPIPLPTASGAERISDAFDLHVEFSEPTPYPLVCLAFSLQTSHIAVNTARAYRSL
jgi:hypothetical protein